MSLVICCIDTQLISFFNGNCFLEDVSPKKEKRREKKRKEKEKNQSGSDERSWQLKMLCSVKTQITIQTQCPRQHDYSLSAALLMCGLSIFLPLF